MTRWVRVTREKWIALPACVAVYAAYARGKLTYVGVTSNLERRILGHYYNGREKEWEVLKYKTYPDMRVREAIQLELDLHEKLGVAGADQVRASQVEKAVNKRKKPPATRWESRIRNRRKQLETFDEMRKRARWRKEQEVFKGMERALKWEMFRRELDERRELEKLLSTKLGS